MEWAHEQIPEIQIRADQSTFFDINSTENKHKSHTSVFRNILRESLRLGGPCFGGKLSTADIVVCKLTISLVVDYIHKPLKRCILL